MRTSLIAALLLGTVVASSTARASDYAKDPVVMVYGYMAPGDLTWIFMKGRLIDDGWPEEYLFIVPFESTVGCNPDHAEVVADVVQEALASTGRSRVDILAHSMGAIDSRYYIKYLCGYQYVKDVVTLSGANQGTIIACLDPISCGAEQMCVSPGTDAWKDNPFLAALNGCDMTAGEDLLYTAVWTEFDEVIVPPSNAKLDGALNHELDTPFVEHAGICLNEEAYQWVKLGLNGGGLNDNIPEEGPCVTVCDEPDPVVDSGPETDAADVVSLPDLSTSDSAAEVIEPPPLLPDSGPELASSEDLHQDEEGAEEQGGGPETVPDTKPAPDLPLHSIPADTAASCSPVPFATFPLWPLVLVGIALSMRRRRVH